MRIPTGLPIPIFLIPALLLLGCGSKSDERYHDSLLPLVEGATWDYRTWDERGAPGARTLRVVGSEGGHLVLETRENGTIRRSFLDVTTLVLAVRESEQAPGQPEIVEFYRPGALRGLARADVSRGEIFERSWEKGPGSSGGIEVEARWTVERVGETVQIAAGIFDDAVRIRRVQSDGNDALLWYAPGVGLLRSEGAETLELVHWALP